MQTTYDPMYSPRPYFGKFLPQGNLNFSNTEIRSVDIFLNTMGLFSRSIEMRAFDSGKFFS